MTTPRCPGQDMRNWKPEDIFDVPCPQCGNELEFWKDEPVRVCDGCGIEVRNPRMDLGCAKWCNFAEDCLGTDIATAAQSATLCDRLVVEMKTLFGGDQRRIDHALSVLAYAGEIRTAEGGAPLVVKAAAILHDIGIQEAERKHGSSAGKYQEQEGPPIARGILEKLEVEADIVDHICRIVGSHHSAGDIDTLEFRIIWDADWLVNIPAEHAGKDEAQLTALVDRTFRTDTGRTLAKRDLLGKCSTK